MKLMGTPSEEDLSFLTDFKAHDYVSHFKKRQPVKLDKKFWFINEQGIDLLQKMLEFNPHLRPSAEECLSHPYLNEAKKFSSAWAADSKLDLEIETLGKAVTQADVRKGFMEEVIYFDNLRKAN